MGTRGSLLEECHVDREHDRFDRHPETAKAEGSDSSWGCNSGSFRSWCRIEPPEVSDAE
jgi:hypothetical protein